MNLFPDNAAIHIDDDLIKKLVNHCQDDSVDILKDDDYTLAFLDGAKMVLDEVKDKRGVTLETIFQYLNDGVDLRIVVD